MEDSNSKHNSKNLEALMKHNLPPSPPQTNDSFSDHESAKEETDIPLPPPSQCPTEILDVDAKTPDKHVPRDPRLIRLTGVHPFNVEPPLSALFNEGFLTTPELFYVRNHGPVPKVRKQDIPDWEFSIEGMVERPFSLTLSQLIADYEQLTYPITLVCAGNRRKEQNLVRKSNGFSWGAAGLATALFTGVAMSEVIRRARPRRGAKFVCMEGADKLPNGYYGTSIKLNWVMDPNRGIMLAHKMNGEPLRPDHGKPLRAVVPGQIGGRSVKWLKRLILTDCPSDNWYHIYDNRVLPTMVSPEESANNPEWWHDERYAIYDLSTNSVAAYPAHEEQICLTNGPEIYKAKGYAYAGGGRRITRVELSLDQGQTWRLGDIEYAEDLYRTADRDLFGGKIDMWWRETCFCWCFWSLNIAVKDLSGAKDLLVRAMDESMNLQPRDMYWSVLGMMNNPWFRVAINKEGDYLRFEHPTQPALYPGGWMERVKKAGGNLTNGFWGENVEGDGGHVRSQEIAKEVEMRKEGLDKEVTIDELRKHDREDSPWFVVNGEVYDGSAFLEGHPGGAQSIVSAAGMDSTDEFMAIRKLDGITLNNSKDVDNDADSETAKAMMPSYHIGTLDAKSREALSCGDVDPEDTAPRQVFLQPRTWTTAVLCSKRVVSWDTRIFTYKLQNESQALGLPTGQHLMIRLRDPVTREAIIRAYTPISETSQRGTMDVLIKVYFDKKEIKGGKMSQAMDKLPIGHGVDFKGPIGKFEYNGCGLYSLNEQQKSVRRFLMICGGSGITPIFQVFRAVMRDNQDPTTCIILDGNRLEEDILCKEELEALVVQGKGRGRVLHTLTKAGDEWPGLKGRIDGKLVKKYCKKDDGTVVLICGPDALEKSIRLSMKEDGWRDDQMIFF